MVVSFCTPHTLLHRAARDDNESKGFVPVGALFGHPAAAESI